MDKKSEWTDMQLNGALKWLHRFVMLITFPFRKFWQICLFLLFALVILIAIPMFQGIKLYDVFAWYKVKMPTHEFVAIKEDAIHKVNQKVDDFKRKVKESVPKSLNVAKKEEKPQKEELKFVSWNVASFRKAKYNSDEAKAKAQNEPKKKIQILARAGRPDNGINEKYYDGSLDDYYIVLENRDLEYLEEPEKLYDTVDVVGPNSLYIADKFVYLYGIYTNPNDYDTDSAQEFLFTATRDRKIHCDIIAYTSQTQAGTALCFIDGVLLNKRMVDYHLADNVGLK